MYKETDASSLCGRAAVLTLGVVDIEDGVPDIVQVECGREEANDGEIQEKDKQEETDKDGQRTLKHTSRMT